MKAETVLTIACWIWVVSMPIGTSLAIIGGKGLYSGTDRLNAEMYEMAGKGSIRWLIFTSTLKSKKFAAWIMALGYLLFKYGIIVW